jgi:hypothetical protein
MPNYKLPMFKKCIINAIENKSCCWWQSNLAISIVSWF